MALVLCIDDDATVAEMVADIVQFCGHEAIIETSSIDAVTKWVRHPKLGVVLSDYLMPKMNGLELCEVFRETRPNVRRVVITAAPDEREVKDALKSGLVQMVVAKPPSIGDIRSTLLWL